MSSRRVIVVGGGAAGFFAAITCAETAPDAEVTVVERGPQFLSKVRISGGGRCNVTHACFDAIELITRFPRGERALLAPVKTFGANDTVAWFESRGVKLKAGRAVAGARRIAADALGLERAGDSAVVGVGRAGPARIQLPVSPSFELAAAARRRIDFRRISFTASNASRAVHRQFTGVALASA